jgi:predicted ATP-grasp superfamily ATP-dependent carboligase
MANRSAAYDTSVPALLFKIGHYPISHGILGAIRSFGRVGVPVYAIAEDRFVPYAYSRFLTHQILLRTSGREDADSILESLFEIGNRLGRKSLLLPTDDEAATLAAEHSTALSTKFILPAVAPRLPRLLASKRSLRLLCNQHGVATPATEYARSITDVLAFAETAHFPIVIKNSDPWTRLTTPAVRATTIAKTREALLSMAATWTEEPQVILQEYIPGECAEDWIFHAYCDRNSKPLVAFTGRKQRSWPPSAGVTTAASALPNEGLQTTATKFCDDIGFSGILDMDWRLDLRDGQYKLVDCNPRIGANFRLFVNEAEIDVVRAAHLDLTGRGVPASTQVFGRRLIVENLDFVSRMVATTAQPTDARNGEEQIELAWFAIDDPLPFLIMAIRFLGQALGMLTAKLAARTARRLRVFVSSYGRG